MIRVIPHGHGRVPLKNMAMLTASPNQCSLPIAESIGDMTNADWEKLYKERPELKAAQDKRDAWLKKYLSGISVSESIADDEDVHLQQAHDALRSRIAKARREKKDTAHLDKRLASITALLAKQKD